MNINFHYFAIKTLASLAGFDDGQAQQIAKYSQFVDDFNAPLVMACSNIPEEITASNTLDLYIRAASGNFRPVSTGFTNPFEYATLILRQEQRFTLSPFHFMPFDASAAGQAGARVIPLAFGGNSLVDGLLHKEIRKYHALGRDVGSHICNTRSIVLMRIGMLLHIFADSHAHQMFTGFISQANRVNITEVQNNITGEDITAAARAGIRGLFAGAKSNAPPIGHVQAGHNPDLSHIGFGFSYDARQDGSGVYFRNNTDAFMDAAWHVFRYLASCTGLANSWSKNKEKLRQGLLVEMPRRDTMRGLAWHWGQLFRNVGYHYDAGEITRGFRLQPTSISQMTRSGFTAYSREFYEYNIMANEILVELYGARPRARFGF